MTKRFDKQKGLALRSKATKGFTLIEMLVVIAIISILIGIGINTFTIAQKKARDTRRKADLRSIQTALELYKGDKGRYPNTTNTAGGNCINGGTSANAPLPDPYPAGLTPNIMTTIPRDPLNVATDTCGSNGFFYGYRSTDANGTNYTLYAKLENTNDPNIANCGNSWNYCPSANQ